MSTAILTQQREFSVFLPFEKGMIDRAKRMVYGVAQLEEPIPDLQGDIVDWDATKRAFSKWAGNVREMHRKDLAVGKALMIRPLEQDKQMLVGVHVSKGAESTWQKVLDGTLSGFSIGGYATKVRKYYDAKIGKYVQKVLDYTLTELSLVDVPANPKCKIVGIQKNLVASGLTGDVSGKEQIMESPVIAAVMEMAKQMGSADEVILIKRSDIETKEVDGKEVFILKSDANVSDVMKQADVANFASSVEEAIAGGSGSGGDTEAVVGALAKCLAEVASIAGIDPVETMQAVVAPPTGAGVAKGLTKEDVQEIVGSGVGAQLGALAKAVDALTQKVDSGSVIPMRKGADGSGAPVTKTADGGTTEGGDAKVVEMQKQLDGLRSKREPLLAKLNSGKSLNEEERTLAETLGPQIDRLEVALRVAGVTV